MLRLIVGSKLPAAEHFERWVFEEVLPAIRQTGGYSVAAPIDAAYPELKDGVDITDPTGRPSASTMGCNFCTPRQCDAPYIPQSVKRGS